MQKHQKIQGVGYYMAWTNLLIASVFEIVFAISLKYTEGFSRFIPSIVATATAIASVATLSQSLKTLPVGTAYALWTGIGAVGTTIMGMILFNEPRDITRVVSIALIICGIIGLKLTNSH
jgi:quaternary ammonium compound-resistance protein SugE